MRPGVNLQYKPQSKVSPEARGRVAETLAVALAERLCHFGGKVPFTLASTAFVLASVFAVAQNPACPPNTATYPCVYVANERLDSISVISANTNKVIGTVTGIGKLPRGLALTPDNATLYVAVQSPLSVVAIDTASGKVIASVRLAAPPLQIAASPDGGFLYITEDKNNNGDYLLERIATNTNELDTSNFASQQRLDSGAFSADGKIAYIAVECPNNACVDIIDTSSLKLLGQFLILSTIPFPSPPWTASIAVTPDGQNACMSVIHQDVFGVEHLGVSFISTTSIPPTIITADFGSPAVVSDFGFGITANGTLYAAESRDLNQDLLSTVVSISTSSQKLLNTIQVGFEPTGVAVGPDGTTVYVTNANTSTVSVIDSVTDTVILTLGSGNGFGDPQGVAAMTPSPPVIATQPASQLILTGRTTTLSVVVTSKAPVSYQWYQGLAGDTSAPIAGAAGSSFTTPALNSSTNYWVQVTNIAGTVDSNTAIVTVTSNQPPTCTLSVKGAGSQTFTNPLKVIATATCVDPQGEALTTTINFGDGVSKSGANSGVFTASHTYAPYTRLTTYPIVVMATNTFGLPSAPADYSWTLVPTVLAPPVFSGQSSEVAVTLALPSNSTVAQADVLFECTTVTEITTTGSATFRQASDLGIECSSNPSTITLTKQPKQFTIVIHTTGGASDQVLGMRRGMWEYAFLVCLPILVVLFVVRLSPVRSRDRQLPFALVLNGSVVLAFLSISCGGGFTAPKVQLVTPSGNYQVTVVDLPANGVQPSGFVQTSLIVPLTVSPFQ